MCGNKLTCKLKDAHEGDCDFGLTKTNNVDEVLELKNKIKSLENKINQSQPDALVKRTEEAELKLSSAYGKIKEIAVGLEASGMTVLSSQLLNLLPEEEK